MFFFFLQKEIEKEEEAEKGQWDSNQTHHPFSQKKCFSGIRE